MQTAIQQKKPGFGSLCVYAATQSGCRAVASSPGCVVMAGRAARDLGQCRTARLQLPRPVTSTYVAVMSKIDKGSTTLLFPTRTEQAYQMLYALLLSRQQSQADMADLLFLTVDTDYHHSLLHLSDVCTSNSLQIMTFGIM